MFPKRCYITYIGKCVRRYILTVSTWEASNHGTFLLAEGFRLLSIQKPEKVSILYPLLFSKHEGKALRRNTFISKLEQQSSTLPSSYGINKCQ